MFCLVLTGCATLPLPPNPGAARARQVTEQAKALIGKPYRYGGSTPAGFDCSGFVCYVYRQTLNLSLPHNSGKLYAATRPVKHGEESPADLIFFSLKRNNAPSHVGIYLGNGQFVHASTTGDNVKISNANDPYWRKRLLGVRRVLN